MNKSTSYDQIVNDIEIEWNHVYSVVDDIPNNADSSSDENSLDSNHSSAFYKSKDEADCASKQFVQFLKVQSERDPEPWMLFNSDLKDFEILKQLIPNTFGNLNIITLLVIIFAFIIHVRLSNSQLEDLLVMMAVTLPPHVVSYFPITSHKFNKIFDSIRKPQYEVFHYCAQCGNEYEKNKIPRETHSLQKGMLIIYDLNSILQLKFKSKEFCRSLLKGIINKHESNFNSLSTNCNGRIHRTLRKYLNVLYPDTNISYSLFTDGVRAFKSSKLHLYPGR
ncbi:MAG TPA: hypothetical protein VKZ44_03965 [Taishania sp.]|nr:hypothetical protein [Taishania sp.]